MEEEKKCYGIIYRVVNTENNKCYIGKTKSHYGESEFGAKGRIRQHFVNAFIPSRKNECPLFYNAIRKYGKDKFKDEILLECDLKDCDMFETKMIELYNYANRDLGYNIALGGKGRSIVKTSEEVRKKISVAQSDSLMNIKQVEKDKQIIGYRVKRRENGKTYQKYFTSTDNTPKENLKLAQQWLDDLINNKLKNNPYNRTQKLPQNFNYHKTRKGDITGYKVSIIKNGKTYTKNFADNKFSMEEKFVFAKEWLEHMKKGNTEFVSSYNNENDMRHINIVKNKKGIQTGYRVKIIKDGKRYSKGFETSKLSLDEKLKMAIEYRDKLNLT